MKVTNKQYEYEATNFEKDEITGQPFTTMVGLFGEQTVQAGDWLIETNEGLLILTDERFNELYDLVPEVPPVIEDITPDKPKQKERGMSTNSIYS
jgi:hypothetical protein